MALTYDNIKNSLVINGTYHLITTWGLAGDLSGTVVSAENRDKILRYAEVSNVGCYVNINSKTISGWVYTDNMAVLYEDLEIDNTMALDGDERGVNYNNLYYKTSDKTILTPYPYYESGVDWNYDRTYYSFKPEVSESIHPWYNENSYSSYSDGSIEINNTLTIPVHYPSRQPPRGVFEGMSTLTEITTFINPIIGKYCFRDCTNLEQVVILGNEDNDDNVLLDSESFKNCTGLRRVILGSFWYNSLNTKVTIANNAFDGDTNIVYLQGQDNIISLGQYAFKNCSKLNILTLLHCNNFDNNCFENCSGLTKVIMPGNATFGSNIFSGCTNIEEIIFLGDCTNGIINMMTQLDSVAKSNLKVRVPNNYYNSYNTKFSSISTAKSWKNALSGNTYQSESDIILCSYGNNPIDGVWETSVAFGWLRYNTRHLTIYESERITNFPSIANDSVKQDLFDKDGDDTSEYSDSQGSHLKSFNQFKWFTNITTVPNGAFDGCYNLTNITTPISATTIEDTVFSGCTSLTSLTIMPSVTEIEGDDVFCDCSSLTTITFEGTKNQWNAIIKSTDWKSYGSAITTISCTDGDITVT